MDKSASKLQPAPRVRVQAMKEYHPPLGNRDAMRLDFNENTIACSPESARGPCVAFPLAISRAIPNAVPWRAIVAEHLGVRLSRWC